MDFIGVSDHGASAHLYFMYLVSSSFKITKQKNLLYCYGRKEMDRVVLVKTVQDVEQMPHPFLSLTSGISASSHPSQFNIYDGEPEK